MTLRLWVNITSNNISWDIMCNITKTKAHRKGNLSRLPLLIYNRCVGAISTRSIRCNASVLTWRELVYSTMGLPSVSEARVKCKETGIDRKGNLVSDRWIWRAEGVPKTAWWLDVCKLLNQRCIVDGGFCRTNPMVIGVGSVSRQKSSTRRNA